CARRPWDADAFDFW
nr:immunoglobulin heavy chain junction region [Macaca mulatta]MOX64398.1 immunoglobulin heavy chain junction region [Macaca mulatta]MOX66796.1 immunoglobulin heavy chain junction region [Macaca mulatta]